MINIYDFFEFIKYCKNKKNNYSLKFKRHKKLSYQPERSKREDGCFVIMGTKECIEMDYVLSDEDKECLNNS